VVFPTLEIAPVALSEEANAVLRGLDGYQLAVFVSRNAVACGVPLVAAAGGWPPQIRVAAVGPGTARALHERGVDKVLVSLAGADSDALAALPELCDVAGWQVVIFRGVGGRETLAQRLESRGAQIRYVECYRRTAAPDEPEPLRARLRAGGIDALTATSSEGLTSLLHSAGTELAPVLLALPLFVIHANIAETAERLGFLVIRITEPNDEGLVRGIISHFAPRTSAARG